MKIILKESQFNYLKENLDQVLDLYSKINKGEDLKPSEKDILRAKPEDFIFNMEDVYKVDEREGMRFKYNLKGRPFRFEFSEEINKGDEIEYYGEVTFNGDEFLGVIVTDKRGYLTDYDFYSVLSNDDVRLQDTLKSEDSESEIQNFFQEEVINNLKK